MLECIGMSICMKLLGTFSNEERNTNDDGSEISHFWFALYFFVRVILGFCFPRNKLCKREKITCFPMKLNKYWEHFCYYVLVVPRTLIKVFSCSATPCRCLARCIQTCSYFIYYCSLLSASASLSLLPKVPTAFTKHFLINLKCT